MTKEEKQGIMTGYFRNLFWVAEAVILFFYECHVSVNMASMDLVGAELFLYFKMLLNFVFYVVFAFEKQNNAPSLKYVFHFLTDFILSVKIINDQNWYITVIIPLACFCYFLL